MLRACDLSSWVPELQWLSHDCLSKHRLQAERMDCNPDQWHPCQQQAHRIPSNAKLASAISALNIQQAEALYDTCTTSCTVRTSCVKRSPGYATMPHSQKGQGAACCAGPPISLAVLLRLNAHRLALTLYSRHARHQTICSSSARSLYCRGSARAATILSAATYAAAL